MFINPIYMLKAFVPYDNFLTLILDAIIIALAVFAYLKFKQEYNNVFSNLSQVNKYFADIKGIDIDYTFEQINSTLSSDNSFIRDEWIDFSKTILRLKETRDTDIVRSTADASLYFNNDIISSHIELDMFLSVSGYLTGLGILGTFFGLMYGLAGIDMSNADKINHGIVSMLSGVGTAFSTSLWGIICATLFSYFLKKKNIILEKLVSQLQKNINSKFQNVSAEYYLSQIPAILGEQSAQLKKFNTEVALGIAEAIDERMEKNMQPTVELMAQISSTLKKQTDQLEKLNSDMAKNIATIIDEKLSSSLQPTINELMAEIRKLNVSGASTIADTMNKSVGKELNSFADVLAKTSENLSRSSDETRQLMMSMNEKFTSSSEKVSVMLNKTAEAQTTVFNGIFKKLAEATDGLKKQNEKQRNDLVGFTDDMVKKLELISENFAAMHNQSTNQISQTFSELDVLTKELKRILSTAADTANKFNDASEPVFESTEILRDVVSDFKSTQESITSASQKIALSIKDASALYASNIEQLQKLSMSIRGTIDLYKDSLENVNVELEKEFESLTRSLQKYNANAVEGMQKYLTTYENTTIDAVNSLNSSVKGIEELTESIERVVNRINK